jgi:signal transduction histidine kinase
VKRPHTTARFTRRRLVVAGIAAAGILATFGAMLGVASASRIGAIALVPWVGLLGADLGIAGGALGGAGAVGLYVAATAISGGPGGGLALAVRAVCLVGVGVAAGAGGGRLAASEREKRDVTALQRALIDSTPDGICLTDLDGRLLISNAALRRFGAELGMPGQGTVPERLLAIADRTTEPDRYRERGLVLAEEPDVVSIDEFELNGSGRVFRLYTAPVSGPDGGVAGRIWTLREVTADRDLERLRDAFVAAVSHELRTPLTSISGFLEMLVDEEHSLSETGRTYLTVIRRSTGRLLRIVEDLLLVAQIEAHRLELNLVEIEPAAIAAAAVGEARPAAAEKGIELVLDATPCGPIAGDEQRLGQVLDNLVSNAIKFTDSGGSVTVFCERNGEGIRLGVADTGVGVPADEQGQLFSRFFRASTATRRAIPGTGLGLVIARAIVEQHGGTISLESREGEGTRVTVALPVPTPREAAAAA